MCYAFRDITTAVKAILAGRVLTYEAFRAHLSHLVNSSDVINCILFLQDEVCCY